MQSKNKGQKSKHLILFDGDCALCQRAVRHIITIDQKFLFCFAPLAGVTAKRILKEDLKKYLSANSLVFVENFEGKKKIYLYSKGIWRIYWLIGGRWRAIGWLFWVPSFASDWVYRIFARHRHKFLSKKQLLIDPDRLLP